VKLTYCRSCEAPIAWTVTTNGKKMPVDADTVAASSGFRLEDEDSEEPLARFVPKAQPGERLYVSHFSTCPNAGDWRGRSR
jgi:hypothetical protein